MYRHWTRRKVLGPKKTNKQKLEQCAVRKRNEKRTWRLQRASRKEKCKNKNEEKERHGRELDGDKNKG